MAKIVCVLYDDPIGGMPTILSARRPSEARPLSRRPDAADPEGDRLPARRTARQRFGRAGPAQVPRRPRPHPGRHVRQGRPGLRVRARAGRCRRRHLAAVLAGLSDRRADRQGARISSSRSPPASAPTTSTCRPRSTRGITVAEVTYCNSISVAEHVVMMILGLVRNYLPSHEWVREGRLEHRRLRRALLRRRGHARRHGRRRADRHAPCCAA